MSFFAGCSVRVYRKDMKQQNGNSGNGHGDVRQAQLIAMRDRIAGGAALPVASTEREAMIALDTGWRDYRRIYCRWYDRCLHYASESKWSGFTCRACPVDEPIDDEQQRTENAALTRRISLFDVGSVADRRRF